MLKENHQLLSLCTVTVSMTVTVIVTVHCPPAFVTVLVDLLTDGHACIGHVCGGNASKGMAAV